MAPPAAMIQELEDLQQQLQAYRAIEQMLEPERGGEACLPSVSRAALVTLLRTVNDATEAAAARAMQRALAARE
ncbi:hypothetical protein CKO44_07740 [Rubrivivax gelatinosus]|nr:hypothetical protein [Rubrivivax gelatinosus]